MKKIVMLIVLLLLQPLPGFAITVSDYLIDANIGDYSRSYPGSCPEGSGILAGADHFTDDHTDYACDIRYYKKAARIGVEVQVTKHSGSDSDKWLLHELDEEFRNYYGNPGDSYGPLVIDGQTILEDSVAGANYRWLNDTKVVMITYHDSQLTKPEPIEVVKAYLAKHPSTLTAFTLKQLRSAEFKTIWIKDEMDRRLWLCDKWFMQLQLQKVQQTDAFQAAVKSMNVFLDYREKYYGIKAADEKNLLAGYLNTNNGTGIKAKLTEYKNWWSVNKDKAISL